MTASQSMSALVGGDGLNAAGPGVVAHDLDARADLDAVLLTLLHQTTENVFGPDVAAEPFVQGHIYALGLEVGPYGLEEVSGFTAHVEVGSVVRRLVGLVHLFEVGGLVSFSAGDVSDLLETEVDRVHHPYVYAVPEYGVKSLGHVEVSDVTAGDARRTRPDMAFFQDQDVPSGALASAFEVHGEMPRGAQAVNSRADDYVFSRFISGHGRSSG